MKISHKTNTKMRISLVRLERSWNLLQLSWHDIDGGCSSEEIRLFENRLVFSFMTLLNWHKPQHITTLTETKTLTTKYDWLRKLFTIYGTIMLYNFQENYHHVITVLVLLFVLLSFLSFFLSFFFSFSLSPSGKSSMWHPIFEKW